MILAATVAALVVAFVLHLAAWGPFVPLVSVPVTALVVICLAGASGRLVPAVRNGMVKIVPKALPAKLTLVWVAGILEVLGAIGLLIPATRTAAAICLALFFIAVFPANVRHAHLLGDKDGSYLRRVLVRGGEQVIFIALCVWVAFA